MRGKEFLVKGFPEPRWDKGQAHTDGIARVGTTAGGIVEMQKLGLARLAGHCRGNNLH